MKTTEDLQNPLLYRTSAGYTRGWPWTPTHSDPPTLEIVFSLTTHIYRTDSATRGVLLWYHGECKGEVETKWYAGTSSVRTGEEHEYTEGL